MVGVSQGKIIAWRREEREGRKRRTEMAGSECCLSVCLAIIYVLDPKEIFQMLIVFHVVLYALELRVSIKTKKFTSPMISHSK